MLQSFEGPSPLPCLSTLWEVTWGVAAAAFSVRRRRCRSWIRYSFVGIQQRETESYEPWEKQLVRALFFVIWDGGPESSRCVCNATNVLVFTIRRQLKLKTIEDLK